MLIVHNNACVYRRFCIHKAFSHRLGLGVKITKSKTISCIALDAFISLIHVKCWNDSTLGAGHGVGRGVAAAIFEQVNPSCATISCSS